MFFTEDVLCGTESATEDPVSAKRVHLNQPKVDLSSQTWPNRVYQVNFDELSRTFKQIAN